MWVLGILPVLLTGATRLRQRAPGEAAGACPEGFMAVSGDVVGWDQFGRDQSNLKESIDHCARDCLARAGCGSFEWSPRTTICSLNRVAAPDAGHFEDYHFCQRIGESGAEAQSWLNGTSKTAAKESAEPAEPEEPEALRVVELRKPLPPPGQAPPEGPASSASPARRESAEQSIRRAGEQARHAEAKRRALEEAKRQALEQLRSGRRAPEAPAARAPAEVRELDRAHNQEETAEKEPTQQKAHKLEEAQKQKEDAEEKETVQRKNERAKQQKAHDAEEAHVKALAEKNKARELDRAHNQQETAKTEPTQPKAHELEEARKQKEDAEDNERVQRIHEWVKQRKAHDVEAALVKELAEKNKVREVERAGNQTKIAKARELEEAWKLKQDAGEKERVQRVREKALQWKARDAEEARVKELAEKKKADELKREALVKELAEKRKADELNPQELARVQKVQEGAKAWADAEKLELAAADTKAATTALAARRRLAEALADEGGIERHRDEERYEDALTADVLAEAVFGALDESLRARARDRLIGQLSDEGAEVLGLSKPRHARGVDDPCPEGFHSLTAVFPAEGGEAPARPGLQRPTVTLCQLECLAAPRCRAFQYSPASQECALSARPTPEAPRGPDFLHCYRAAARAEERA